jgi:hypothetical protein
MCIRPSISALALLLVFSTISGCKEVKTLELSRFLTPIIHVREGDVLIWKPSDDLDLGKVTVTITPEKGLCKETGPFRLAKDKTVQCTILKQQFRDEKERKKGKIYNVNVESHEGAADPEVTYEVAVRPCKGC